MPYLWPILVPTICYIDSPQVKDQTRCMYPFSWLYGAKVIYSPNVRKDNELRNMKVYRRVSQNLWGLIEYDFYNIRYTVSYTVMITLSSLVKKGLQCDVICDWISVRHWTHELIMKSYWYSVLSEIWKLTFDMTSLFQNSRVLFDFAWP